MKSNQILRTTILKSMHLGKAWIAWALLHKNTMKILSWMSEHRKDTISMLKGSLTCTVCWIIRLENEPKIGLFKLPAIVHQQKFLHCTSSFHSLYINWQKTCPSNGNNANNDGLLSLFDPAKDVKVGLNTYLSMASR